MIIAETAETTKTTAQDRHSAWTQAAPFHRATETATVAVVVVVAGTIMRSFSKN